MNLPRGLVRILESQVLDARVVAALPRILPALAGRGPSLGIASQLNARAFPGKEAVVDRDGTLSWGELDARVNRLARGLPALGVEPGQTVATLLRNGREQVEAVLASQKAGVTIAPMNTWAKPAELRAGLDQTRPRLLLYDVRHRDQVPESLADEAMSDR